MTREQIESAIGAIKDRLTVRLAESATGNALVTDWEAVKLTGLTILEVRELTDHLDIFDRLRAGTTLNGWYFAFVRDTDTNADTDKETQTTDNQ